MLHFLRHHGRDPAATLVVNIDNIGGGDLCFLRREGMVFPMPASSDLVRIAEDLSQELGKDRLREGSKTLLPTDAQWPMALGYAALTFIGQDARGRIPHYHWVTDVLSQVSESVLNERADTVGRFLERVLEEAAKSA